MSVPLASPKTPDVVMQKTMETVATVVVKSASTHWEPPVRQRREVSKKLSSTALVQGKTVPVVSSTLMVLTAPQTKRQQQDMSKIPALMISGGPKLNIPSSVAGSAVSSGAVVPQQQLLAEQTEEQHEAGMPDHPGLSFPCHGKCRSVCGLQHRKRKSSGIARQS